MLAEAQLAEKNDTAKKTSSGDLQTQVSMDQYIIEKAREQGKKLKTFETLAEQFRYLQDVFTLNQLREMLQESAANRGYYRELAASFNDGNSDAIDAMVATMPQHLRELLLDERNENWEKKFDQILSPAHTMIAVGAAHLGGPKGLIRRLERKGFRLQPLKAP